MHTILTAFFILFFFITIGIIVLIACKLLAITEIFWAIIAGMFAYIFFMINHRLKLEKTLTDEEWEQLRQKESEYKKVVRNMKMIIGAISIIIAVIALVLSDVAY